jgi:hypothetical protein
MIGNLVALEKDRQKRYGIATSARSIFARRSALRYIMRDGEQEYRSSLTMIELEIVLL